MIKGNKNLTDFENLSDFALASTPFMTPSTNSLSMQNHYPILASLLFAFCFAACNAQTTTVDTDFMYDLDNPIKVFKLDKDLEETSGLSLTDNPQQLVSINDEDGKLFFIDISDGEIVEELKFGKDDDYEGVEMVNGLYYVLESNGNLHEIEVKGDDADKLETYDTFLKREDDVEGLGYDAANGHLLLACKAEHDDHDDQRVVFAFDLESKELLEEPVLRIYEDSLYQYIEKRGVNNGFLRSVFAKSFAPSTIALHPKSGDWYVLSSPKRLLLVLSADGTIKHLAQFDDKLARQPEGICFAPDGTLYVSSEGDGAKARLLIYAPKGL